MREHFCKLLRKSARDREPLTQSGGAARSARTGRQSFGARSAPRRIPKPTLSRSRP
jgi:hypothetical protein